jgi:anion-transporting  ArsA/GET3 family ATPase
LSIPAKQLAGKRLVVVTGKGGVGKSTLSASLGRILAGAGHRVLLLEIDPRESLCPLFGVAPSGGEIVRVAPNLFVQNLRPRDVLDQLVRERVRLGVIAERVLASPVYHHFAEGAPGLEEMAVIGHAHRAVRGRASRDQPAIDLVVLDAPATGHGLSLLAAPLLVSEVIHDGPVGHLAVELADFVSDRERCGTLVVTAAEEMPVQEAIELIAALHDRFGHGPELVLVNGLYPPCTAGAGGSASDEEPFLALWRQRRGVNERELGRLEEVWDGPRIDLPLLPLGRGPELVAALEARLAQRPGEAT